MGSTKHLQIRAEASPTRSVRRLTWALMLTAVLVACGSGSKSGGDHDIDAGGGGDRDAGLQPSDAGAQANCDFLPTGFVCVKGTVADESGAGLSNVAISVLGQPDSAARSNARGAFALPLDTRLSPVAANGTLASSGWNPVEDEPYAVVFQTSDGALGRTVQASLAGGVKRKATDGSPLLELGVVQLLKSGNIAGQVTLAGRADHSGTRVYLPGTSYGASSDSVGGFVISRVPPGLYPLLRYEHDGFSDAIVANVQIPERSTLEVASQLLSVDTGAAGSFEFVNVVQDGQGTYSTHATVQVAVVASDEAILMMLSESSDFVGASWQPIQTQVSHSFAGDGDHALYLKLATANGLASAPVQRTITIETNPKVSLSAPAGSVSTPLPSFDWNDPRVPQPTYVLQVASDVDFSQLVVDATMIASSSFTPSTPLAAGTYYARVAIAASGTTFGWSNVASFEVYFGTVTVGAIGETSDSTPTITWTSDMAGASYSLQLAKDAAFAQLVVDQEHLSATSYTPTSALETGSYYARVAIEANGTKYWSNAVGFVLGFGVIGITPVVQTSDTTPTLTWTHALSGFVYDVEVASDSAFTQVVAHAEGLTAKTYTVSPPLSAPGTYHVRVAAVDPANVRGAWTSPSSFELTGSTVLPQALLQAFCDWEFRCCSTGESKFRLGAVTDSTQCVAALQAELANGRGAGDFPSRTGAIGDFVHLAADIDLGHVALDSAGVQACIGKWDAAECGVKTPVNDGSTCKAPTVDPCSLRSLFNPRLEEGSECELALSENDAQGKEHSLGDDIECKGGLTCVAPGQPGNTSGVAKCVKRGSLGQACSSGNPCDFDLYCNGGTNTCAAKKELGVACASDGSVPCAAGLRCDASTLQCVKVCQAGALCGGGSSGWGCPAGQTCAPTDDTGMTMVCGEPAVGRVCGDDGSAQQACVPSQFCHFGTPGAIYPTCSSPLGAGSACFEDWECDVSQGLHCLNDIASFGRSCQHYQDVGSMCREDPQRNNCPPWAPCGEIYVGEGKCLATGWCYSDTDCESPSHVCQVTQAGGVRECSNGAPIGSVCDNDPATATKPSCARGLVCPFGTCVQPLAAGSACGGAASGDPCFNKSCVTAWGTQQCSDVPAKAPSGQPVGLTCDGN